LKRRRRRADTAHKTSGAERPSDFGREAADHQLAFGLFQLVSQGDERPKYLAGERLDPLKIENNFLRRIGRYGCEELMAQGRGQSVTLQVRLGQSQDQDPFLVVNKQVAKFGGLHCRSPLHSNITKSSVNFLVI
jgi:hypothetical protein